MGPFIVFTKPWKDKSLAELARFVRGLGFDGVELPVRPGFAVSPENAATQLPAAARLFAEEGLKILSVAADPTEDIIRAMGSIDTRPILRTMVKVPRTASYLDTERAAIKSFKALVPILRGCGIAIGVQNHDGEFVANASGVRRILDHFEPDVVGAVWDPAHCALAGEIPEHAIDLLWSHLLMVNLKNAMPIRTTGPEAVEVQWHRYWTAGNMGCARWSRVAELLAQRGYTGPVCLCAEYGDASSVERLTAADLAYAQSLFHSVQSSVPTS
ncbi:MAG: hypothetical protein PWP23_1136 [Candidatus Sumerlaeota bacterium]|nr:hypothetical protein [Candidatus Sumerlaeota bacterium]